MPVRSGGMIAPDQLHRHLKLLDLSLHVIRHAIHIAWSLRMPSQFVEFDHQMISGILDSKRAAPQPSICE
jgi:hypothetical protein